MLMAGTNSKYMSEVLKEKQLSFGEKLVGLTFNPSGNLRVQRAKELCAELAAFLPNPCYRMAAVN